jgi:hypothetical protein
MEILCSESWQRVAASPEVLVESSLMLCCVTDSRATVSQGGFIEAHSGCLLPTKLGTVVHTTRIRVSVISGGSAGLLHVDLSDAHLLQLCPGAGLEFFLECLPPEHALRVPERRSQKRGFSPMCVRR